jgi:uncharacterized protein YecE (DUF72 family)
MRFFVGMSGWTFPGWRGGFYPEGLPQKKELEFSSRQVNSIEINGTFYRIQNPKIFRSWYQATPEHFIFSLKAPKFITHVRRLKEVESAVANFLASGVFCLKEKLGPLLWQFPPNVKLKDDRFEKFLKLLPHTAQAASELAKKHSSWMNDKAETSAESVPPLQHAFEFRHPSFFQPDFLQMLKAHGVAAVFATGAKPELCIETPTSPFVYCRMHGQGKEFAKGYPKKHLNAWAEKLRHLQKSDGIKQAFVYFDTEAKEYAPRDALQFMKILKG